MDLTHHILDRVQSMLRLYGTRRVWSIAAAAEVVRLERIESYLVSRARRK